MNMYVYDACDVTLTYVRFPPWPGIFFKLAQCGYTLGVTSQASYSPEYITPTEKKSCMYIFHSP